MRTDRGTENSIIAFLQPTLRHTHSDTFAREKSFQYGRSTANQVLNTYSFCLIIIINVSIIYSESRPGGPIYGHI